MNPARHVHGTVVDGLPCVVFRLRSTGTEALPVFSMVSAQSRELLELEPTAMALDSSSFFDRIVPEDADRVRDRMRRALREAGEWHDEFRVRTAHGDRLFELRARVRAAPGGAWIADGFLADVGSQRHNDELLEGSGARHAFVFDAAPQPILIADPEGRTRAVNRAFINTFGYRLEDIPDREARVRLMVRDDAGRERFLRRWGESQERFRSMGRQPEPIVMHVTCKDGTERLVELRTQIGAGESVNILTDISETRLTDTERQRLLTDREETHAELAIRSHMLPVAIVAHDPTDAATIREWNPAAEKLFGFTREEMVGTSVFDQLVPRDAAVFVGRIIRRVTEQPETVTAICRNLTKDGRTIWCEWTTTAVRETHGQPAHIVSTVQDVTERIASEERRRLWTSVLEQNSEGIMICSPEKKIVIVNAAFERLTGYSAAEVIGQSPGILRSGVHDLSFYKAMWKSIEESDHWAGEIWNRRKNGEVYPEWLSLNVVRNDAGEITHYVGIFSDITERKAAENRMQRLAQYDALTELPNRALLLDRLEHLVKQCARDKKQAAVMFLDLDYFKEVNDSLGHEAGDKLLQAMVARITSVVRKTDTVARMGGDEFVVLLPGMTADTAPLVTQKLLAAISTPVQVNEHELRASASIGVCIIPNDGETASELLRNADAAMYRAKRGGRNAAHFYARELNDRAVEKLRTESALRLAIERNELVLHYQPQIDLVTGQIVGAEGLVRWIRPGVGLMLPGLFIPLAEERGLISAIDQWVLREAARQARAWDVEGLRPITVAVNVSAADFHSKGFVESVSQAARDSGLAPSRIELELTEGIAVKDVARTTAILKDLHTLGFKLSLDDFGTGYSSLNYLRNFPIDKVKIDRSFVREIDGSPGALRTVRAIIGLAKSYSMTVIAEGVEERSQLQALRAEGCDEFQGYLAAAPMPADAFAKLLRNWRPL